MSKWRSNIYVRVIVDVRADNAEEARIRARKKVLEMYRGGHIVYQEVAPVPDEAVEVAGLQGARRG